VKIKHLLKVCSDVGKEILNMANRDNQVKASSKRFRWALDYTPKSRPSDIANPPGYNSSVSFHHTETTREVDPNLIVKRSWDFALGPIKQVPMNLFLMYMAGNSISIFPIMMVGMLFMRPIKAMLSIASAFKMIEGSHHLVQKLVFCLGNLVNLGVALYKCQSMGLLPTHASDWLAFVEPQERMEFYGGGLSLF